MSAINDRDTLLAKLREPFPPNHISKLPKESRSQIDARKADRNTAINCTICGGWHHKHAVHLDYVGHAALTDRLLDTDIEWSWEPVAFTPEGLPAFDRNGGLWIKLTVQGVTRLGYGAADGKSGGDAVKEIIGDALRNAAMRFGAALDLWHKGDLHADEGDDDTSKKSTEIAETEKAATWPEGPAKTKTAAMTAFRAVKRNGESITTLDDFEAVIDEAQPLIAQFRLADHPWWYGGSGEDKYESIPEWIFRRRAELASVEQVKQQLGDDAVDPLETEFPGSTESFKMMIADMRKADAPMILNRWKDSNRELVNSLDKTEVKAFRKAFEDHMETLQRAQKVAA